MSATAHHPPLARYLHALHGLRTGRALFGDLAVNQNARPRPRPRASREVRVRAPRLQSRPTFMDLMVTFIGSRDEASYKDICVAFPDRSKGSIGGTLTALCSKKRIRRAGPCRYVAT